MQTNLFSPVLFILVFVLILLSIVAICYLYITAKNRERLALIEKGMDPNLANSRFWPQTGLIAGGIAAGLIVDDLLGLGYGPLVAILFAGGSLFIYHAIWRSKTRRYE